jgi:hypothetical protein
LISGRSHFSITLLCHPAPNNQAPSLSLLSSTNMIGPTIRHGKRLRRMNGEQRRLRKRLPKWRQVKIHFSHLSFPLNSILARTLSSRKSVPITSNHTGCTLTMLQSLIAKRNEHHLIINGHLHRKLKAIAEVILNGEDAPKSVHQTFPYYIILLTRCCFAVQRHGGTTGKLLSLALYRY